MLIRYAYQISINSIIDNNLKIIFQSFTTAIIIVSPIYFLVYINTLLLLLYISQLPFPYNKGIMICIIFIFFKK